MRRDAFPKTGPRFNARCMSSKSVLVKWLKHVNTRAADFDTKHYTPWRTRGSRCIIVMARLEMFNRKTKNFVCSKYNVLFLFSTTTKFEKFQERRIIENWFNKVLDKKNGNCEEATVNTVEVPAIVKNVRFLGQLTLISSKRIQRATDGRRAVRKSRCTH